MIESNIRDLLHTIACEILDTELSSEHSLIEQGLDSLTAEEILEQLRNCGYDVDYDLLLNGASIDELISKTTKKTEGGPTPIPAAFSTQPQPLLGPQILWAQLEQLGWGSWANISLCISMPTSALSAAFLPAIAQSLCDANDAMRMVLVRVDGDNGSVQQKTIADYQIPIRMHEAPQLETEAMRMIEAFEREEHSPFNPTTRAMVLRATGNNERHWLCITMHHIFADREAMHILTRQISAMIGTGNMKVATPPSIGYLDYAYWQFRRYEKSESHEITRKLKNLLRSSDIPLHRIKLRLTDSPQWDLGPLPHTSVLTAAESHALNTMAVNQGTTLPLLIHALYSVLIAQLTKDNPSATGQTEVLTCHVVANRENHKSLRSMVGCLDTSIPVVIHLQDNETLQSLCSQTRSAFTKARKLASHLPRGEWLNYNGDDPYETRPARLFEEVPHINVIRSPDNKDREGNPGITVHPVQRVQRARWGSLLRVTLPAELNNAKDLGLITHNPKQSGIELSAFAEHKPLAIATHYCLVQLLHKLLGRPGESVGATPVLKLVDQVINQAEFAVQQVQRSSEQVTENSHSEAFIWEKLADRQQRWFEHNDRQELRRDQYNRFIGTAANPFPFTQLDKLQERQFLDSLDVPQTRILHVLPYENLVNSLVQLQSSLPPSFVIKPIGAGHSFGVTLVRDGKDLTRGGISFDAAKVATELVDMAKRGYCEHEGHKFLFNFSSFLVEEYVVDEFGHDAATDYKAFVISEKFLWAQILFQQNGHKWVAFVDENFDLLSQPAWNPKICWRTHRTLVCTEPSMLTEHKPECWESIVKHSRRLGEKMGLFVRLDWYADHARGPLMGEITTFPHILQPRSFYSAWANQQVMEAWQDPNSVTLNSPTNVKTANSELDQRISSLLNQAESHGVSLRDFLPPAYQAPWAVETDFTYAALRQTIDRFDLAPWGVEGGDCVALLIKNGAQLGCLLLATMNRYVTLPIDSALPVLAIESQLKKHEVKTLVVISATDEAGKAQQIAESTSDMVVIQLSANSESSLVNLPTVNSSHHLPTPSLGLNDLVLKLHTSGTTGEAKVVGFTLSRLLRAGSEISRSLALKSNDLGIAMLPLNHVGGITCNLIAPMLTGSAMKFCRAFDPKVFFNATAGAQGATWCYLVPTLWSMLLDYAGGHPDLKNSQPWKRLRLLRSAGSDLPHALALRLSEFFGDNVRVLPTYGMTEAMPIASPPLNYRLERPCSVGRALPGVSVEIVSFTNSGNRQAVDDGTVGEITVKGPNVLERYESDDESLADYFTPRGYFRTGDLGKFADDGSGWLYVTDRIKNAINRGGETIAPAEIESVFKRYPGFQEYDGDAQLMIFARKHTQLQEDIALALAPLSVNADLENIRNWAAYHLPDAMVPQTLIHLPELPYSTGGKLLRSQFVDQMNAMIPPGELGKLQVFSLDNAGAAPSLLKEWNTFASDSAKSEQLASTLESVLSTVQAFIGNNINLGPDTDLTDAGVNSLASVELTEQLSNRFAIQLPTWAISDSPTPRLLASQIDKRKQPVLKPVAAEPVKEESNQEQEKLQHINRPIRILLLHGEGADAELMDLSLRAAHWTHGLEGRVEFVYINSPHTCPPKAQFHSAAVEVGLYKKDTYHSWGATKRNSLESSIAIIETAMDELEAFDGIGGICDGGLVAALVASRRPELKLYLNFSSSPLERLPEAMRQDNWVISCATIHLLSAQDEMYSLPQLMEISEHCEKALILKHQNGHRVPELNANLKKDVLGILNSINFESTYTVVEKTFQTRESAIPPVTDTERTLINIWKRTLSTSNIGRNINYFALGGNSLRAVEIFSELEKHFNFQEPISVLLEKPTVELLARHIDEQQEKSKSPVILTLKSPGSKTPIFLLHAQEGNIFFYQTLAQKIAVDRAVYAIQSVFLTDSDFQPESLEELATYYLKQIRSIQPSGPYLFFGRCFGGVLMLEVANQVLNSGDKVNFLCVLDSAPPKMKSLSKTDNPATTGTHLKKRRSLLAFSQVLYHHWTNDRLPKIIHTYYSNNIKAPLWDGVIRSIFPILYSNAHQFPATLLQKFVGNTAYRIQRTKYVNRKLKGVYKTAEYAGNIVQIRSSTFAAKPKKQTHLLWKRVCGGRLTTHIVQGTHNSIFTEPEVDELARTMRKEIDLAESLF